MIILRILLGILVVLIGFPICFFLFVMLCSLFVDSSKEYDKNSRFNRFLMNVSCGGMFFYIRTRLHVTGMEKVPNGRFVLVSNHRSNFDPITSMYAFRKHDIAYISKESNFHIPFYGKIIRKVCFMSIDREDPRKAMKTIERAANLIKDNQVSIGVYPEGTRNKEPEKGLLPFHNVMFRIAQMADVPIVVMSIHGAEDVAKNFPLKGADVYIDVLDVLSAESIKGKRTGEIGDKVAELINGSLEKGEN